MTQPTQDPGREQSTPTVNARPMGQAALREALVRLQKLNGMKKLLFPRKETHISP